MSPDDGLPPRVCDNCATRLLEAHILRQQIQRSHRSLMDHRKRDPDASNIEIVEDVMIVFKKGSEKDVEVYNVKTIKEPSARNAKTTKKTTKTETKHMKIESSGDGMEEMLLGETNAEEEEEEDGVSFLLSSVAPDTQSLADTISPAAAASKSRMVEKRRTLARKHECSVCQKAFSRKSNLVDHLRLHANMRPFECEICHATFVQMGNLKAHMRIHTKERPYECNICGKTYNQSGALKVHIRAHTNERNHKCETCGKGFTNASDRNKHSRVHDEQSHFKCPECERSFAQRVNLKLHMAKYHGGGDGGGDHHSPARAKPSPPTQKVARKQLTAKKQ